MYNAQYNNSTYNSTPPYGTSYIANGGTNPIPSTGSSDAIVFDGYGLQNANIITSNINYDDLLSIELNSFKYPRENGGGVLSKFYRGREIKLEITVKSDTGQNFNTLMDTVKKNLRKTEGYLSILVNTERRRIKATCTKFDTKREYYNITFCKIDVTFTTLEPFFYAETKQSYNFLGKTGTFSEEVTNLGSTDSLPVFYHIFGAGSAVTNVAFTAFSRTLSIANTFAANDILIIDAVNKSVTKNGVEIDYTGAFPVFPPGSNPFTTSYTGTVLADVTLIQDKNYL